LLDLLAGVPEVLKNMHNSKENSKPMLMYLLYEAGEKRISKNVAVKVVRQLLEFKDRTGEASIEVVFEIFKIANMVYRILRNKKHLCGKLVEETNLEKVIRLIT